MTEKKRRECLNQTDAIGCGGLKHGNNNEKKGLANYKHELVPGRFV
jgi:hypothetical protein